MKPRILNLTLKAVYFDQIECGEKPEEYREQKPYWEARLVDRAKQAIWQKAGKTTIPFKEFDIVRFRNGYSRDARTLDIEFKGIEVRGGNPKWGAVPGVEYYVISLGKILTN